jgi:hypothetical protein
LALCAGSVRAAGVGNPSYLNIDVTIAASLSVSVVGQKTSSQTVTWTGQPLLAAASTATVKNDTGLLSEKWQLSTTANSLDAATGAAGWSIASSSSSLAADQVALQAVFGSSMTALGGCPATGASVWDDLAAAPVLTNALPQTYTDVRYADAALNNDGDYQPDAAIGTMFAASERALCWRLAMPPSTSLTASQIVPVIVTATP